MAVIAYVGKPGHGKTNSVVERVIIPSLKQGRHVVTNIPLNIDDLLADFGGTITQLPEDWYKLPDLADFVKNGCVLILDEVWRRWPNGQKANQAIEWDKALLAEHRHMVDEKNNSMRIILVTQDLSQIASHARTLIETTFRIVKLSKTVYRVDVYSGVVTGDKPPASKRTRQYPGKFNKVTQSYYKSATKSATGDVGDESVADKSASFLRSYGLWALIAIVVIGLLVGVFGIRKFFNSGSAPAQHFEPVKTEIMKVSAPAKPSVPTPPPIVYSQTWRLTGFIHPSIPDPNSKRDSSVAVLVDKSGRTRYIAFSACRFFSDFKEAYCDIEGERVTTWTSQSSAFSIPPLINGLGGGAAQRSASSPST
jgi:zona occludens toxin